MTRDERDELEREQRRLRMLERCLASLEPALSRVRDELSAASWKRGALAEDLRLRRVPADGSSRERIYLFIALSLLAWLFFCRLRPHH